MFSHIDESGSPRMVDVSHKQASKRTAAAQAKVALPADVAEALRGSGGSTKKGPVFDTAVIAGVMAAKRTHELIPFCHPLGLEDCRISINLSEDNEVVIRCEASVFHKTGVEMEALTGASVAALTVYDMCKALSHDIVIRETRLVMKRGGKSDYESQDDEHA